MDTYFGHLAHEAVLHRRLDPPSIAGLRSSNRVKSITSPLQMMRIVGRIEFLVWTTKSTVLTVIGPLFKPDRRLKSVELFVTKVQ